MNSNTEDHSGIRIVNIYGQEDNHCDGKIIGNKYGLLLLLHLISDALEKGKASTGDYGHDDVMASDGEGYELIVECHKDQWVNPQLGTYWTKKESNPQYIINERML